ncbi:MAG: hypothetical protein V1898_04940 [Patescibacteria group bacterium]
MNILEELFERWGFISLFFAFLVLINHEYKIIRTGYMTSFLFYEEAVARVKREYQKTI